MTRNTFSDMTPRKRSIRDIPLPQKQQFEAPRPIVHSQPERIEVDEKFFSNLNREQSPRRGKMWFVLLFVVGAGFWGASVLFHAATINVTPEKAVYQGVIDISARTDAAPGELQYDSLQFVESASKKVSATAEETVALKSSGKIVVYNSYSTTPQKLIANTRFEATNGKVYRITEAATVPGYKTANGEKVPGSVELTIVADVAGETHNGTKTDFKIPGFKGTPQYDGFYARSTTDLTGGFEGKQKKVDPKVLSEATEALKREISSKIPESVASKIPADFIFLSGGETVEFVAKPIAADGDNAVITIEAQVRAFVFKKEGINDALQRSVQGIVAQKVIAHDYSKLAVSKLIESTDKKSLQGVLSGDATIFAVIEKDALTKELSGIKKSLIGTVMNTHPEIVESKIYVRPPWMLSLPENPERIHIIEQIDE